MKKTKSLIFCALAIAAFVFSSCTDSSDDPFNEINQNVETSLDPGDDDPDDGPGISNDPGDEDRDDGAG